MASDFVCVRDAALAALRGEKQIGPHFKPHDLTVDADGVVTIDCEVEMIAIKRLAFERLPSFPASVA